MPKSTAGELAFKACKNFPESPSLAIARYLKKKYPLVFNTIESARSAVRLYRGNRGDAHRQKVSEKSAYRENGKAGFVLPKSYDKPWTPFVASENVKKWGIIGDLHIPYHSEPALMTALEYMDKIGISGLILNGDIIDFYKVSRFQQNPLMRKTKEEVEAVRQFLATIRKQWPKIPIIYKEGNHDFRLEAYIISHAVELYEMQEIKLPNLLGFDEHKIEWVNDKRPIKIRHLSILHGDELPKGLVSAVNPARGAFLRTTSICLVNHFHQTSNHVNSSALDNHVISTWSNGCLCGLNPDYARINKWNHGLAVVTVDNAGDWECEAKKIIKGKVV